MRLGLVVAEEHVLIPRASIDIMARVRGRAHISRDGRGGNGVCPGGRWGLGRRATAAGRRGRDGGARRVARARGRIRLGFILARGALAEDGAIGGGQVEGCAEGIVLVLQF